MSKVTISINEELKKWTRSVADESMALNNMSDVIAYCIKYVKKNPEVLPQ